MVSSGEQRTAWVDLLKRFSAANPDVEVIHREFAQEEYKQQFERYLVEDKVDIAFWFASCSDSRFKPARLAISGFSDSDYLQMTARSDSHYLQMNLQS